MPLIKAQCPNCGGALELDPSKGAALCPFCDTPFLFGEPPAAGDRTDRDFEIENVTLKKYLGHGKEVVIPDYIEKIEEGAFADCAFITGVTVPDSVTAVGWNAFQNCTGLEWVNITSPAAWCGIDFNGMSANPLYYARSMRLNGKALTELVIPAGVTAVPEDAFKNCAGLTRVVLPEGVAAIGENAFENCKDLVSVSVPDSVVSVGKDAFWGCEKLTYNAYGNALYLGGASNPYTALIRAADGPAPALAVHPRAKTIGSFAFFNRAELTDLALPEGLVSIGKFAFFGCAGLTRLSVPASVRLIDDWAFKGCKGLADVQIGSEETQVSPLAFEETPAEKRFAGKKPGGCYVATCVYGSYDCPQVWTLRRYRDDTLAATWPGRAFIRLYYAVSPGLVRRFGKTKWFKKMWQGVLDRLVKRLNANGVADTPYRDR